MGVTYDHIPPNLITWIKTQHLFFVGTSALGVPSPSSSSVPSSDESPLKTTSAGVVGNQKNPDWGFTNISPKDMGGFEVVGPNRVRYQDVTGSGVETIAHLRQPANAKLTIMFVALSGGPRIVRLFGKGRVYERSTREFEEILPAGDERIRPGCRAIIELDVQYVGTSCGFSIPFFDYVKERPVLDDWARKRVKADLLGSSSSTPSTNAEGDGEVDEETEEHLFSRLLAGDDDEEVPMDGLRRYWDHVNSRSRDLLVGLDELAPKNQVRGGARGEKVEVFKIGGNEVELVVKADGSARPVQAEDGRTTSTSPSTTRKSQADGDDDDDLSPLVNHRPTKEESEASNAKWDSRILSLPSDSSLSTLSIDENTMYSGKTVLKLVRLERMKGSQAAIGWDQLVLGVCLLVVGGSIGMMVNGVLLKFGIVL